MNTTDQTATQTLSGPRRDAPRPGDFAGIESWIFDLDNTLYPASCDLFAQVDRRMGEYIANLLELDAVEAKKLQKQYYYDYGTTLRGLMTRHRIDPSDFLGFVHDIDVSPVAPAPSLHRAITALPGRCFVLTNGSTAHADNVIDRLGLTGLFEGIFDIAAADYVPKPEASTYDNFIARWGVNPAKSVMFEDLARNLAAPHALGMKTVLVHEDGAAPDFVHAIDGPGTDAPHVDFVTGDLAGFLAAVIGPAHRTR